VHEIGGERWIEALSQRLATRSVDPELRLVVQQSLTGPDPAAWHVVAADGELRVHRGPHDAPDVVLTSDAETASAIAEGRRSARREFLDGRLRIGGDIVALMAAREMLAAIT
jgi:predicted lipid carrier protein YhbT